MPCFNPAAASLFCDETRHGELRDTCRAMQNSSNDEWFRPYEGSKGSMYLTRSKVTFNSSFNEGLQIQVPGMKVALIAPREVSQ